MAKVLPYILGVLGEDQLLPSGVLSLAFLLGVILEQRCMCHKVTTLGLL